MSETTGARRAPETVTINEAARLLDVSVTTLGRNLAKTPGLGFRVFGRWRVRVDAIDRILAGEPLDSNVHVKPAA